MNRFKKDSAVQSMAVLVNLKDAKLLREASATLPALKAAGTLRQEWDEVARLRRKELETDARILEAEKRQVQFMRSKSEPCLKLWDSVYMTDELATKPGLGLQTSPIQTASAAKPVSLDRIATPRSSSAQAKLNPHEFSRLATSLQKPMSPGAMHTLSAIGGDLAVGNSASMRPKGRRTSAGGSDGGGGSGSASNLKKAAQPKAPAICHTDSVIDLKAAMAAGLRDQIETEIVDGREIIRCGTFISIVEWLIDQHGSYDPEILSTFLVCYRRFHSPKSLWLILTDQFPFAKEKREGMTEREIKHKRDSIIVFLHCWIDVCGADDFFSSQEKLTANPLWKSIHHFLFNLQKSGLGSISSDLVMKFQTMAQRQLDNSKVDSSQELHLGLMWNLSQTLFPRQLETGIDLIDIHPHEIANCLTMMEYELFAKVSPMEFVQRTWSRDIQNSKAHALVERFNRVSFWVASEIVTCRVLSQRTQILDAIVQTASRCLEMNNFNSLQEILAGLNLAAVQRLKKTWEGLSEASMELFQMVDKFMTPMSNYKTYRGALKKLRTEKDPCLPYVGLFLRDMTFIDENPDYIKPRTAQEKADAGPCEPMINFGKMSLVHDIVKTAQAFQTRPYVVAAVDDRIANFMSNLVILPEDSLYYMSLQVEPRQR
eukprot:TRINITY_DN2841_c0_g2_i1.p1 TRINITY_DN2841_c0_g2~~TRINITY_DN2841_c0_g2_i1.p1  ORF type:complete len:656 (-),score=140.63 TRINITY_DN2841_c0_g2_i1:268-2235(-)